ncbi:MAG: ABC transporter ATP-binding protein [Trueperaceae bacterium]|nr:ABC transporter ATP-binding protein [Trueperaceae bacterium]
MTSSADSRTSLGSSQSVVGLRGVAKRYSANGPLAVDSLDLDIVPGEILCLLGPSGCGKTTLLRLISGFERPDAGSVTVAGNLVAGPDTWVRPERRRIGFVFQDFALFPHLNVLDNVAFGLKGPRHARRVRAAEVLALVGLTVFQARYPHQISGGQQQRVALARALATEPHILLLDEPFSNLDASLRGATRHEVRAILKRTGTTAVMVTHDQEEALSFADRLAVMRDGQLEQIGDPETVYYAPRTAFVANFLGRTNLLRGVARGSVVDTVLGQVRLSRPAEGPVVVSLRPEHLSIAPVATDAPNAPGGARARVVRREFKGHDTTFELHFSAKDQAKGSWADERILVTTPPGLRLDADEWVSVSVEGEAVTLEASVAASSAQAPT